MYEVPQTAGVVQMVEVLHEPGVAQGTWTLAGGRSITSR